MKKHFIERALVACILTLLLVSAVSAALYTRHKLTFNVASRDEFSVAIFTGGSAYTANLTSNSTLLGNTTALFGTALGDIMFNSTTGGETNVQAFAAGGTAAQDATHAILRYYNSGTVAGKNIFLNVSATPTCANGFVSIQAANNSGIYTNLSVVTRWAINTTLLDPLQWTDVWLQANFTTCSAGSTNVVLVSSEP